MDTVYHPRSDAFVSARSVQEGECFILAKESTQSRPEVFMRMNRPTGDMIDAVSLWNGAVRRFCLHEEVVLVNTVVHIHCKENE